MIEPNPANISGGYRFGFNGKEDDDEINGSKNAVDFGARIFDARLSRFLTVDPLTKKYPYWTPYIFAGASPIRYIEIEGMGPGDHFASPNEAATDFGLLFNDNSIRQNEEYGSYIYEVVTATEIYYSYTDPAIGVGGASVTCTPAPTGTIPVADIHTHAAYDPGFQNNVFSPADKNGNDNEHVDGYLVTPNGSLKKYDYVSKDVSTLATNMPSDVNDPSRKNSVDATKEKNFDYPRAPLIIVDDINKREIKSIPTVDIPVEVPQKIEVQQNQDRNATKTSSPQQDSNKSNTTPNQPY